MSAWKLFEHVQNHFLTKFLTVFKRHIPSQNFFRCNNFPMRFWDLEKVVEYQLKVQKSPSHALQESCEKQVNDFFVMFHVNVRYDFCVCFNWMQLDSFFFYMLIMFHKYSENVSENGSFSTREKRYMSIRFSC